MEFTLGNANSLADESGNVVPNINVYVMIEKYVIQQAELYDNSLIKGVASFEFTCLIGRISLTMSCLALMK